MEAELNKSDNYIQLKNENILKIGIKDEDGKVTGDYLEFDLEDIELPLIYQNLIDEDKKNKSLLKQKLFIINKKEDRSGKKLLSYKEEEGLKAMNEFFKKEIDIYNMFLGENGVQKLLHGRKLRWTTLAEIDSIIQKDIFPKLRIEEKSIESKINFIKSKYLDSKEENVIE